MTIFPVPIRDLITDAAIAALDSGREQNYADHDTREYFLSACATAFDVSTAEEDADPEPRPDAQP